MRTALQVEFDRKVALDSFDAVVRSVRRAGVSIRALASVFAKTAKSIKRDVEHREELRKLMEDSE